MIDPIGFAFEHYDGIGRWRDIDGEHTIDPNGEILLSLSSDGSFSGIQELSRHLATSSEVSGCYVQQWFIYGMGRGDLDEEEVLCGIEAATLEFNINGTTLQSAPRALTTLDRMYTRFGELGEMDTLARSNNNDEPPEDTGDLPDTGEAEPIEDLTVEVIENSNWGSGYCNSVTVTNTGTIENTWVIELAITDIITSLWSANSVQVSGGVQFSGVDWNATIQPNQSAEFGFCANL